jgi:RNA polymerase-binding protein DksA
MKWRSSTSGSERAVTRRRAYAARVGRVYDGSDTGTIDVVTGAPTDRRVALDQERVRVTTQVEQLRELFDSTVEASRDMPADDEHDPDGATIGFERAQVASLLERAQRRLADLDSAMVRLEAGAYGVCTICGQPIAPERLDARPTAQTCVRCAK